MRGAPPAIVPHDREFLNQLVGSIVEIRQSRIFRYRGNYEDYLTQRAAQEELPRRPKSCPRPGGPKFGPPYVPVRPAYSYLGTTYVRAMTSCNPREGLSAATIAPPRNRTAAAAITATAPGCDAA